MTEFTRGGSMSTWDLRADQAPKAPVPPGIKEKSEGCGLKHQGQERVLMELEKQVFGT